MNQHEYRPMKQKDAALLYVGLIRKNNREWELINRLIIERWSKSGLMRIKRWAWSMVEQEKEWEVR